MCWCIVIFVTSFLSSLNVSAVMYAYVVFCFKLQYYIHKYMLWKYSTLRNCMDYTLRNTAVVVLFCVIYCNSLFGPDCTWRSSRNGFVASEATSYFRLGANDYYKAFIAMLQWAVWLICISIKNLHYIVDTFKYLQSIYYIIVVKDLIHTKPQYLNKYHIHTSSLH